MRAQPTAISNAMRSLRTGFIVVGLFSLAINLMMLGGPLYMLQIYDRVLTSQSFETLIALTLLLAGVFVVSGFLDFTRTRIANRLGARFEGRIGGAVFDAVLRRKVAGREESGDAIVNDMNSFRDFLSGSTLIAFFDTPWVPVYLVILFVLHPYLGLLGLFGALTLFFLAALNDIVSRAAIHKNVVTRKAADGVFDMCERNAEAITSMGMGRGLRTRWTYFQTATNLLKTKAVDRISTFSVISRTFRLALQSGMLGLGAALAISGESSPGVMIAATIILSRALAPIDQIIGQWRTLTAAMGSYRKMQMLLKENPAPERAMTFPRSRDGINVSISQAGAPMAKRAAISGIQFSLSAGDVMAMIGPSGSGKSTLAKMIAGIWHPQRGEVVIGGLATNLWNADELGDDVGYLPQHVELLEGTVRENISRFATDVDDTDVLKAAKNAGVHEMILQMPAGYDTQLGAEGVYLSGGESQRIGLARALYKDPFILVLDEPNANLDATGDSALRQAVHHAQARGAVVIVVTHRPSTLEAVNKVLVLEDGRQRSFGDKENVMRSTTRKISDGKSVTSLPQRAMS